MDFSIECVPAVGAGPAYGPRPANTDRLGLQPCSDPVPEHRCTGAINCTKGCSKRMTRMRRAERIAKRQEQIRRWKQRQKLTLQLIQSL